ncbi:MAG: acetyl-CoA carboxylase biotin carboxyl carrier protein [Evtepia gabavorous]
MCGPAGAHPGRPGASSGDGGGSPAPPVPAAAPQEGTTEVTSPMVGVFYAAPAENAEPFVKVGDRVKRGQTLCIVEAMKLMNEIMAELDGEIVEVCVQNGQVVDFGCPLFRIKGQ